MKRELNDKQQEGVSRPVCMGKGFDRQNVSFQSSIYFNDLDSFRYTKVQIMAKQASR
jgi:hypothetical protein